MKNGIFFVLVALLAFFHVGCVVHNHYHMDGSEYVPGTQARQQSQPSETPKEVQGGDNEALPPQQPPKVELPPPAPQPARAAFFAIPIWPGTKFTYGQMADLRNHSRFNLTWFGDDLFDCRLDQWVPMADCSDSKKVYLGLPPKMTGCGTVPVNRPGLKNVTILMLSPTQGCVVVERTIHVQIRFPVPDGDNTNIINIWNGTTASLLFDSSLRFAGLTEDDFILLPNSLILSRNPLFVS